MTKAKNEGLAAVLASEVSWKIAYPAVENEVKLILKNYEGDGIAPTQMLSDVGLDGAPQLVKRRFFNALNALAKKGLRDWFDVVEVRSPYHPDRMVRQRLFLPPSTDLKRTRLQDEIKTLSDLQAGLQKSLDKLNEEA